MKQPGLRSPRLWAALGGRPFRVLVDRSRVEMGQKPEETCCDG